MNRKRVRISGIRAQATTELALFGAALLMVLGYLLTYGLNYNFQDNLNMKTFRQAMARAYELRKTTFSSNIVAVEDKPIPETNEMGVPTRQPVIGYGSVTWSNDLYSSYDSEKLAEIQTPWALPQFTLIVRGREYTFTTGGYKEYSILGLTVRKKESDTKDGYINEYDAEKGVVLGREVSDGESGDNIYWYWEEVPHTKDEIKHDKSYDLNEDNKEETVLKKTETVCVEYDAMTGECTKKEVVKVVAMSDIEGEIDFTQNTQDIRDGKLHGGFQASRYDHSLIIGKESDGKKEPSSFRKQEGGRQITTTNVYNYSDRTSRYVLLNKITDYPDDMEYLNILQQIRQSGYENDEIFVGDKYGKEILDSNGKPLYNITGDEFDARTLSEGQFLWLKITTSYDENNKKAIWITPK